MRNVTGGLALLAIVPALAVGQQSVYVRRSATPDISVRVAGTFAVLRIVGTEADSVILTGTLPRDAKVESFVGGKGAEPLRGAKVFVEAPDNRAPASGVLELRVPHGARVWAKAGNATIEAQGVTGGLDLNIIGGAIRVTGNPRELNIESMDGDVNIDGNPAWLRAKTAAGDITHRGAAEDAAFTTVSGTIRVGEGPVERGRFESVTGRIEFSGTPGRGGALTFDSHSGPIELRLSPSASLDLDATSITGTIENLLTRARPVAGRDGRGRELSTSIGGGGVHVTVRSFKGTIRLTGR